MERLTWAGAHGLGLLRRACLTSSARTLSFFSVGTFLWSGGLVPWKRTGYLKDSKDITEGQRSSLGGHQAGAFETPVPVPLAGLGPTS